MKSLSVIFAACALLIAGCTSSSAPPDAVYFLVRHAEKQLDVDNPPLTDIGQERAQDLAERLSGVDLRAIYSTDYIRTMETAAPTAAAKSLNMKTYDPSQLPKFAEQLLSETGNILVTGHSNTTPQLAKLLGAEPGTPIDEATEYNRLYVITRRGTRITGQIETYGN